MRVCVCACISICSSVHQFISSSIHQSINLSIHRSINLSIDPSINRSIFQSIYQSSGQSVNPSIHSSIYQCIYSFICISLYLFRENMMNMLMANVQQGIRKHSKANESLPSGHSSFHCISCSKSPGSSICKPEMLVEGLITSFVTTTWAGRRDAGGWGVGTFQKEMRSCTAGTKQLKTSVPNSSQSYASDYMMTICIKLHQHSTYNKDQQSSWPLESIVQPPESESKQPSVRIIPF